RIDHVISSRQQIYARWSWKSIESNFSNWLLPASTWSARNRNLIVSHNYGLRPNLTNEFRFGLSWWRGTEAFPILGKDAVATLGLQGLDMSRVPRTGGFPYFDFYDGTGFDSLGHGRDGLSNSKSIQFTDNLSWIKGRHTMKFGFDIRRLGYEDVLHSG